jgi:hypothetical protein
MAPMPRPSPSAALLRALLILALAGLAAGAAYLAVVVTSDRVDDRGGT